MPSNPFRSNPVTPNPTGASNGNQGQSQDPPPFSDSASNDTHTNPQPPAAAEESTERRFRQMIDEEPPAYTPTADVGETIVDRGPRRPFQQAPQPSHQQQSQLHAGPVGGGTYIQPQNTGISSPPRTVLLSPASTGLTSMLPMLRFVEDRLFGGSGSSAPQRPAQNANFNWSTFPGSSQAQPPPGPPASPSPGPPRPHSTFAAPPPPQHPSVQRRHSGVPRQSTGSDFARDFYAAGAGDVPEASSPSGGGNYAPPAGPPPPSSGGGGGGGGGSSSGGQRQRPDERPTKTPVPGRRLLKEGKILVYPKGYECVKCNNTGYKAYDPSNPCKKCWPKYSKPYTETLLYAPAGDTTLQRPLPNTVGPRSPQPPPPQQYPSYPPPPRPRQYPTHSHGPFTPHHGALVVQPGDPRIGGRLCWRCGGDGKITAFLFDTERCPACGGTGRIMG